MGAQYKTAIVVARCSRTKQSFGIRFTEKNSKQWFADWAFAINDASSSKGHGQTEITGGLGFDPAYPGCPHCEARGALKCGCGKVACWDGVNKNFICPWCNQTGTIEIGEIDRLSAASDL
jgi:hypothetical protein